jgi:predicted RNA binding protein YcfA (HicA-like mRNA interferase family)
MTKSLTFGELESALRAFGYEPRRKSNHMVFEHPNGKLMIIFPRMYPTTDVTPLHQKIVEKTIRDDEVVSWDDFKFFLEHDKRKEDFIKRGDHLIWKVPGNGQEIRVSAAADEQDGLVIIKQKGTFAQCPVEQLRKDMGVQA